MKRTLHLSIPKPCHENWNAFTPTTVGGFCGSCQKEVIDFTTWDEERILAYFKLNPLNTCGRFRVSQLRTYVIQDTSHTRAFTWHALLMAGLLALLTSRTSFAQSPKNFPITKEYHQTKRDDHHQTAASTAYTITGVITSTEDGSLLPGVNVAQKGTANGTSTDADGRFSLTIENPRENETLVFSFIGLLTVERPVSHIDAQEPMKVTMELSVTRLGEIVTVPWYSPRRWWWGIKGLFR